MFPLYPSEDFSQCECKFSFFSSQHRFLRAFFVSCPYFLFYRKVMTQPHYHALLSYYLTLIPPCLVCVRFYVRLNFFTGFHWLFHFTQPCLRCKLIYIFDMDKVSIEPANNHRINASKFFSHIPEDAANATPQKSQDPRSNFKGISHQPFESLYIIRYLHKFLRTSFGSFQCFINSCIAMSYLCA